MSKWFCVSGKQIINSERQKHRIHDIHFYLIASSKKAALTEASQTKTLYLMEHPQRELLQFEFEPKTAVSAMEKHWTPEQLQESYNDKIVIVAPYVANDYQLQIIGSDVSAGSHYCVLLKNRKGEGRWFPTSDAKPYQQGEWITFKNRKHLIIAVLPLDDPVHSGTPLLVDSAYVKP